MSDPTLPPWPEPADGPAGPCSAVTATAADGASVTGCAHGGHVLGWTPAGGGEALWTSPLARCGAGEAIRGGIPVIFPRFSDRPLPGGPDVPRHGLARSRAWRLLEPVAMPPLDPAHRDARARDRPEVARLRFELRADAQTAAEWPHAFALVLAAAARGRDLEVSLEVANTGTEPFAFAAALHTYLRVHRARDARVVGLAGLAARDNADGHEYRLPVAPLVALGPRDVALPGAADELRRRDRQVVVADPVSGEMRLATSGFADLVLWNPGADHGLTDVPAGGADSFVCLEPALLTPYRLGPGRTWRGSQRLTATAAST